MEEEEEDKAFSPYCRSGTQTAMFLIPAYFSVQSTLVLCPLSGSLISDQAVVICCPIC